MSRAEEHCRIWLDAGARSCCWACSFSSPAVSLPLPGLISRPIQIPRRSSLKSPPRPRASPPRRWSATTQSPWRSGSMSRRVWRISARLRFYGLSFVRVTFKYGIDYFFAYTQTADQPAAECQPARRASAVHSAIQSCRRGLSLSDRRPAAFRIDQPAHRAGLDRGAAPVHGAGCGRGEFLGRHDQAIRCRRRSQQTRRL